MSNEDETGKRLSEKDMETPEQREAERAESLAEFRRFAEPMLDEVYAESRLPFDLPRDVVIARVTERIFDAIVEQQLQFDPDFMMAATEVVGRINEIEGNHFVVGKYPIDVLRHHLAEAMDVKSGVDVAEIDWTKRKMEEDYQSTTGKTLSEWAQEYRQSHPDASVDLVEQSSQVADIFNKDYDNHSLTVGHFTDVLREHIQAAGISEISTDEALKVLVENGFVVPIQWKEEYAEHDDGKTLITAIESINKELQTAEIVQTLEATYADLSAEEQQAAPIGANDILAVASLEMEIPETWEECDEGTQKAVRAAMKELAEKLGGKLGSSKGVPIIKFGAKK